MISISLTNSKFRAIIDDEDFELASKSNWYFSGTRTKYVQSCRGGKNISLHHLVLGISDPDRYFPVLHLDDNTLNNQKSNLVQGLSSDNQQGVKKGITKSKYLGVTWFSRDKIWVGQIQQYGQNYYFGRSHDEKFLARKYNEMALKLYGPLAKLNKFDEEVKNVVD